MIRRKLQLTIAGMRRISNLYFVLIWLACFLVGLCLLPVPQARSAESQEEFNLDKDRVREDNLLNLIFGPAPPMPTQRGTLIIDAFHDRNGNGRREEGEDDLEREVLCLVDDIEYTVPAFIPGLDLEGNYRVLCTGERYRPEAGEENVFIRSRGEIIYLDLPCSSLTQSSGSSHQPSTMGK